jgi:4-amino-4-deoxy-L-arabinose transferase-like glycosyltransferase
MNPAPAAHADLRARFAGTMLAIILLLFATRNLPWHLDDYDQAKQAFVAYQMVEEGRWLYQETPAGRIATKPPLQGWLSALVHVATGAISWEFAWRVPPLLAALLVLRTLWRTGGCLFGSNVGAVLAAGAFGLNLYVPRLATLVRTDMLLAACIFFVGWMVLEKVRKDEPWTLMERLGVLGLVLASMLTKGPIAFAFLLPGIVAFQILARRWGLPSRVWCGWLPWLVPLGVFAVWAGFGTRDPEFEQQVVHKEFLGRFTVGEKATHNNQVPGFYTLNLLVRTLPWTLLLGGMFLSRGVREACKRDAALLWLLCWTLGGLLFMECVPSKRFDRILPVVPPMCLLLAAAARHLPKFELFGQRIRELSAGAAAVAACIAGGYTLWELYRGFHADDRVLVRFGSEVRETVQREGGRLAIVNGKDEGMLMYAGVADFARRKDAIAEWQAGHIEWLVLGESDFAEYESELAPYDVISRTPLHPEKFNSYRLLRRPARLQIGEPPLPQPLRNVPAPAPQKVAPSDWQPPGKFP